MPCSRYGASNNPQGDHSSDVDIFRPSVLGGKTPPEHRQVDLYPNNPIRLRFSRTITITVWVVSGIFPEDFSSARDLWTCSASFPCPLRSRLICFRRALPRSTTNIAAWRSTTKLPVWSAFLSAILARSGPVEGVVIVGSSSSCEDSRICCLRQADNGERRRRLALGRFVLAERAGCGARVRIPTKSPGLSEMMSLGVPP